MVFDIVKNGAVCQIVYFGTGFVGGTNHFQGLNPFTTIEFNLVNLAITTNGQAQPF